MDEILMNLEAKNKSLNNPSNYSFGNFQPSFNPNQYIDDLVQIVSQDQQEYSNDSDDNRIQRDEDHDSNDDVFGEADLIQLQERIHRRKGKKFRGRVHGQMRGKTGVVNGTINLSAQSSHIKQITSGSNFNFGSCLDIDMEQMMERDLTQTQPTTNEGPIVSTTPPQLGTASWHAGE
ncbi:MAG: hypothetical protein EZS28_051921, partial [Streblomastix strix]